MSEADSRTPPIALVTGGGTGIGAASARRLARAGFEVILAGRRLDRLEAVAAEIGPAARTLVLDVTDQRSVDAAVASLARLDVLVNNAGGALGLAAVQDGDLGEWEAMFATNVLGPARMVRAVLPLLRRSPRATIVDMSSTAGEIVYEGGAGYCAAKHGTSVLSEALRLELAGENIRICDIRPGMVRTDEFALTRFHGDQDAADRVYAGVDRPLTADDVAACVEFVVTLPQHVNIDRLVVKPVAQAAAHKVHRGPIDWHEAGAPDVRGRPHS